MSSQTIARAILTKIKENPQSSSIIEAIYASRMMYPPKKNINKFLAGGSVEVCVSELIQTCGYTCTNVSSTEVMIDILVKNDGVTFPFSVKSIRKLGSAVTLENYRGKKRDLKELPPTFIVVIGDTQLTLAYLDNDIVTQTGISTEDMYTHADSNLSMKGKFVKTMITSTLSSDYVIHIPVPSLPTLPEEDISTLVVARARSAVAAARQAQ